MTIILHNFKRLREYFHKLLSVKFLLQTTMLSLNILLLLVILTADKAGQFYWRSLNNASANCLGPADQYI